MILTELLNKLPSITILFVFFAGTIIGSFLNVVVYRLPLMLQESWSEYAADALRNSGFMHYAGIISRDNNINKNLTLAYPRSHCPTCKRTLKSYHLLPVVSFIALKGKCQFCESPINFRYPAIEFICGVLTSYVIYRYQFTWMTVGCCFFIWILICLSFIDIEKKILPDFLTILLLWSGIIFNLNAMFVSLEESVIGAIFGYLFLWAIATIFKLVTRKDGMGQGDVKLFAALGAWVGWSSLPILLVLASCAGIFGGCIQILRKSTKTRSIAFGPYLASAGFIALLWGNEIKNLILR